MSEFVTGREEAPELPECEYKKLVRAECNLEFTPVPSSYTKEGEPVFDPEDKVKRTNITCLKCHAQWMRTEEDNNFLFRLHTNVDAKEFVQTIHAKDITKTGDDYMPELLGSVEEAEEYEEDLRRKALESMTQYQRDLAMLGEHFIVHKDITAEEFAIVMRARYPEVPITELFDDIEQHMDPFHRRGEEGDWAFYFSRVQEAPKPKLVVPEKPKLII